MSQFTKIGVAKYYFDVLRLMLEYILGENYFFWSFDSYSNALAVKTLISQYFLSWNARETITVPKTGHGKGT